MAYGPEGSIKSKIVLVGEAPAKYEMISGKPFTGPSGSLLNECLHSAKIIRGECYITNLCDHPIKSEADVVINGRPSRLNDLGLKDAERLREELIKVNPNIIVAIGKTALIALTTFDKILKYRGSILECSLVPGLKVIPCIHPAAVIRGNYLWRYNIIHDMRRVRTESRFPQIHRPVYQFELDPPFEKIVARLQWIKENCKIVSIDIEVANHQCSRIAFAWDQFHAISFPFENSIWDEETEIILWDLVAAILEDPDIETIGQNWIFDSGFLWAQNNILCKGKVNDTMVGHHIMYPDFPKGLDYLCSLYTDQPYYKTMVKHGDVEKDDG